MSEHRDPATTPNTHPPVITSNGGGDTAAVSVAENTRVVTTITATDADAGSELRYAIIGGDDRSLFQIDSVTGALWFKAAPDFEKPGDAGRDNQYVVQVGVSDGSLSDTQTIAVTVTNVNEAPVITSNEGKDAATVAVKENTTAVTTVVAHDPDAGTVLTYSIAGGPDAAAFHIDAATGALSFATAPHVSTPADADHDNTYVVEVRASDGTLFDTQRLSVHVAAANEVVNEPEHEPEHPKAGDPPQNETHPHKDDDVPGAPPHDNDSGVHGDFGGDHRGDVVLENEQGTVALWQMHGTEVAGAQTIGSVGREWHITGSADLNGDGKSDLVWRADSGSVMAWQMDGNHIQSAQIVGNVGTEWHLDGSGDLDGDGRGDMVWRSDSGTLMLWRMNGTQIQSVQSFGGVGNEWHIVGVGDFDGDGKSDLLWRSDSGTLMTFEMNGTQIRSAQTVGALGTEWHVQGLGDFNGDGKQDILLRDDGGTVMALEMDGGHVAGATVIGSRTSDWHAYGTGDFDGDGTSDILWRNDNGTVAVWEMHDGNIADAQTVSPLATDWSLGVNHFDLI